MKQICSDKHHSILHMKFKEALKRFTWDRVWRELSDHVPTLLRVIGSRNSENAKPALCVCTKILLKLRNPKMNLVQALVSLVLKAGHASIQVIIQNNME